MDYLNTRDIQGIKLQLLHVLKGTDLAYDYLAGKFKVLERAEYIDPADCLEHLDPSIVIHRVTRRWAERSADRPSMGQQKREVLESAPPPFERASEFSGQSIRVCLKYYSLNLPKCNTHLAESFQTHSNLEPMQYFTRRRLENGYTIYCLQTDHPIYASNSSSPITNSEISEFILDHEYTNYFHFATDPFPSLRKQS